MKNDIVTDKRLSYGERLTYLFLSQRITKRTKHWDMPKIEEIAEAIGCDPRSASRFLAGLVEKGFITRKQRLGLPAITALFQPPTNQNEKNRYE